MKDFIGPTCNVGSFFEVPPARQPVGVGNGLKLPKKGRQQAGMKPRASRSKPANAGNQKANKYT